MSQILAVLIALTAAAVAIWARREPQPVSAAQLGCVSERWLAEYRASHPI
jgi:hypothetical protein